VLWWEENHPGSEHTKDVRARLERQQRRSALRRQQLLGAIPQWYQEPASAYWIKEDAWGSHAGVGYGSGTARAMLLKLAKEGLVEAIEPDESYRDHKFRLVNDGTVPEPPPPPPREPESRRLTWIREADVIDHFRYGLTASDPGETRWHMEQIAAALDLDLDFDYEPGKRPA
jgi:hypothetical protein